LDCNGIPIFDYYTYMVKFIVVKINDKKCIERGIL